MHTSRATPQLNDLGIDKKADSGREVEDMNDNLIKLRIGDVVWTATLVKNPATEALKEMLAKGP